MKTLLCVSLCLLFFGIKGYSQQNNPDSSIVGRCGASVELTDYYMKLYENYIKKTKDSKFVPDVLNDTFTAIKDFPANEIVRCGNFRLYYKDFLQTTLQGFAENGTVGDNRRTVLCQVLEYIQSIISINSSDTLDIYVDLSWNIPPLSSGIMANGSTYFLPHTWREVPGFYAGNVYNHIKYGIDPDSMNYDGVLRVNFGYAFIIDTAYKTIGSYDLYSILLHEMTHALGFASGIREGTTSDHYPFCDHNTFTRYDSIYLYYGSIHDVGHLKKIVVIDTSGNPSIDSDLLITQNCLRNNKIWMTNDSTSKNQPVYSGIYLGDDEILFPGSLIGHLQMGEFSFYSMSQYLPGYQPIYVMGPTMTNQGDFRRKWTLPEFRLMKNLGYTFRTNFMNSKSLNGLDSNHILLEKSSPYRLNFKQKITEHCMKNKLFPDTCRHDTLIINYNTSANPNVTTFQLNISSIISYIDDDNDTITIFPGSLFGIQGVDTIGNEHSQLSVAQDNSYIQFKPYPDFSGRAQFGFYLYDGHEKGALIIYTIDVIDGVDNLIPNKELVINGTFEQGIELRQYKDSIFINKPYSTYYAEHDLAGEYYGGVSLSSGHKFTQLNNNYSLVNNYGRPYGGGDYVYKSSTPGISDAIRYYSIDSCLSLPFYNPLPKIIGQKNERYHRLCYSFNFSTLTDSIPSCSKMLVNIDLCYRDTSKYFWPAGFNIGDTLWFRLDFISDPYPNPEAVTLYMSKTCFDVVDSLSTSCSYGVWNHFSDTIYYCGEKCKNIRLVNLNSLSLTNPNAGRQLYLFMDNLSLKLLPPEPMTLNIMADTTVICQGQNVTLTSVVQDTVCPVTYLWYPVEYTTKSITVSPGSTTTYHVAVSNNCTYVEDSITVTVHPTPDATASVSYNCQNDTIFLYGGDGVGYNWSGPKNYTSSLQNPILYPILHGTSGIYHLTVTDKHECTDTASVFVPIIINTSSNSPICSHDTLRLFVNDGDYFEWTGPDGFTSSSQNPIVLNPDTLASGWYVCNVASDSTVSCSVDSVFVTVYYCCSDSAIRLISSKNVSDIQGSLPQKIAILGELVIDTTYTLTQQWNQMDITILPASGINILEGDTLKIKNAYIHGCQELWNVINLENSSSLKMESSTIEDALFAVTVHDKASLSLINNHFHKNYVGLYYPEPKPWNDFYSTKELTYSGNEFDCENATLLPPMANQISDAGAYIYSLTDASLFGDSLNIYHHMRNGIVTYNSNLTVYRSKFYNIIDNVKGSGKGIYSEAGKNTNFMLVKGEGGNDSTFTNCTYGIHAVHMNTDISYANMNNVDIGTTIEVSQDCDHTIQYNTFNCNDWGIILFENDPVNKVDISYNQFKINSKLSQSLTSAIYMMEFNNPPKKSCEIHHNIIEQDTCKNGIYTISSEKTQIFENSIAMNKPYSNIYGIVSQYCLENDVHCNSIWGIDPSLGDTTLLVPMGIRSTVTQNTKYSCNNLGDLLVGAGFHDQCLGDSIQGNIFNDHTIGLYYNINAITGEQRNKGNVWDGSYNGGYAAKHTGDYNVRILSRYYAQISLSYLFPPSVFGSGWFNPSLDPNFYLCYICEEPENLSQNNPDITMTDYGIANGSLVSTNFEPESRWMASRYLYNKIRTCNINPSIDPQMQIFYDSIKDVSEGKFQDVEIMNKLAVSTDSNSSVTIDQVRQEIISLMRSLLILDSLKNSEYPTIYNIEYETIKSELTGILNELYLQFYEMRTNAQEVKTGNVNVAMSQNEMLPSETVYEQNEKIINEIYLNTIGNGISSFTDDQANQIAQVA
ncbi:MAG: hypothetical protein NTU44_07990, partial [Bacteroidetes bacterium]|nr:hypothetical protein [Bacteroidota bacterium]